MKEFYSKLKMCLESEAFAERLLYSGEVNSDGRREFLVKCLYFLISTRDFEYFNKFLYSNYRDIFPYEYLKSKENLPDAQVRNIIYNNFIKNGFLFHVTPTKNVEEILKNGLLTLNDKYKCDLYKKSLELNETYLLIRERNSKLSNLFKLPNLINIPGINKYDEDRFNTVYLSSNLDYILKTYGETGELFKFFSQDLLWAFNSYDDVDILTKEEFKNKILLLIKESNAIIHEKEIDQILDFIETIYDSNKTEASNKSILLVPTNSITSNYISFEPLYKINNMNLSVETILDFNEGEIGSANSIPSENIIVIDTSKDKKLSLKIKR